MGQGCTRFVIDDLGADVFQAAENRKTGTRRIRLDAIRNSPAATLALFAINLCTFHGYSLFLFCISVDVSARLGPTSLRADETLI